MSTKEEAKEKYFEGVGRRKNAIARVRIFPGNKQKKISVNKKDLNEYFTVTELKDAVFAPLEATDTKNKFYISVRAYGGGIRGQAEAIQLGIARALVKFDGDFQRALRDLDYLKRDPRKKERKKFGLRKARRAPQWSKR
jgi:small subunit ribosomal protein S9